MKVRDLIKVMDHTIINVKSESVNEHFRKLRILDCSKNNLIIKLKMKGKKLEYVFHSADSKEEREAKISKINDLEVEDVESIEIDQEKWFPTITIAIKVK